MARKPIYFVTRFDGAGRAWYAKRNGFYPNGRLAFTWIEAEKYDEASCVFTKVDALDIVRRQEALGLRCEARRFGVGPGRGKQEAARIRAHA